MIKMISKKELEVLNDTMADFVRWKTGLERIKNKCAHTKGHTQCAPCIAANALHRGENDE